MYYATSVLEKAELVTTDTDFVGLDNVIILEEKRLVLTTIRSLIFQISAASHINKNCFL